VLGLALACLSGSAFGQINVNETGLHDANSVYGINGSAYAVPWTNDQRISLFAWGQTDPNLYLNVSFNAYGIFSNVGMTNRGDITVSASGGNVFSIDYSEIFTHVTAYGIRAEGEVDNTGILRVFGFGGTGSSREGHTNAYAIIYGIYQVGAVESGPVGRVDNSGPITVSARGGDTSTNYVNGYADATTCTYGISAYGDVNNTGNITADSTGGTAHTAGTSSSASAEASAKVFGIHSYNSVYNAGDISVNATGGAADSLGAPVFVNATAYGIYGDSPYVSNGGVINVTAVGGNAYDNNGRASAYADATGILNYGDVANTGGITVTATGGIVNNIAGSTALARACGLYVYYGDVTNRGDITVSAAAGTGFTSSAYGIYLYGNGNLTNTGTLRASGDEAYELYIAAGTTTLIDAYNVTLDGDPTRASIFIANGATLALNNANLTVTDVEQTQWDTEYRLFEPNGTGLVSGSFGEVRAINPDADALYHTQGTSDAGDDTVSLTYAPQASEALASSAVEKQMVLHAADAIDHHMTSILLDSMLEPDGWDSSSGDDSAGETTLTETPCQRASGAFVEPYYSHIEKDAHPLGYNAGLWGSSTGYTQCVGNSLLGLHLGYGRSNIDYTGDGYNANSEDQDVVTTGFGGLTRFSPWALRYGVTSFYGWHDYSGLTGLSLNERETASYDSYGGTAAVGLGRTFRRGKHVFFPEIGANWLWAHRQEYTTEATNSGWDTTYSVMDDHDLVGEASLYWQSRFMYRKLRITPSASLGIRQLLTDGEADAWQSIPGTNRVQVECEQDETAITLAGGLVLRRLWITMTLAYDGEFSSDVQRHDVWMRFKWQF
jgi:hypothetical protein